MQPRIASVAACALALACTTSPDRAKSPSQASPPAGKVVVTETEFTDIERGPGVELCEPLDTINAKIEQEQFESAEVLVDEVIDRFDTLIESQQTQGLPAGASR